MRKIEYLTVQQLAERLQVTVGTVYGWNKTGRGPRRRRFGTKVRYKIEDVERWEDERIVD